MDTTPNSYTREQELQVDSHSRPSTTYYAIEVSRTNPVLALKKSRINYKCLPEEVDNVAHNIRQMKSGTCASVLWDFRFSSSSVTQMPEILHQTKEFVKTFDLVKAELAKDNLDNIRKRKCSSHASEKTSTLSWITSNACGWK